jgi:hypothetical protein
MRLPGAACNNGCVVDVGMVVVWICPDMVVRVEGYRGCFVLCCLDLLT